MQDSPSVVPKSQYQFCFAFPTYRRANNVDLSKDYLVEFSRNAMACKFEILLHPEWGNSDCPIQALDTITFLDQLLSVYVPTSELSLLNERAYQEPIPVSHTTFALLELGLEVYRRTEGAFDMTSNSLSKAWGFYRRQGRMPTPDQIADSLANAGSSHIVLDEHRRTVFFNRKLELNPGGIGKGFALDCAAESLRQGQVKDFAFHGGRSSILCRGSQTRHSQGLLPVVDLPKGWRIAVRHPEQAERILGSLMLFDQALGTSGPANQFFYFQGNRYGHIIDPRTGWPAQGMLSITVLHPSAGWADALATGLFVLGIDKALEFCERSPETAILAILPTQRAGECEVVTANMQPGQWEAALG